MAIGDSMRKMAEKAKDAVGADKAKGAVDKGADKLDEATGGKGKSQVDKGQEAAKDRVDKEYDDES